MNLGRIGLIGRFKPLHNGAAVMLEAACEQADSVVIGVGSSNKYNARNPFTAEESKEMITRYLSPKFKNYEVVAIPDFAHMPEFHNGDRWKQYVVEHFGSLDHFISGNEYVAGLLKDSYDIIPSYTIVPQEKRVNLKAAQVRYEMATYGNWQALVPEKVAMYLQENNIVDRFRKEFGLETIARLAGQPIGRESWCEEQAHTYER